MEFILALNKRQAQDLLQNVKREVSAWSSALREIENEPHDPDVNYAAVREEVEHWGSIETLLETAINNRNKRDNERN